MAAEVIDWQGRWRYVSADPVPPDPVEVAKLEAALREADRRNVSLAKRKAAAPLKPAKPQEPCDVGLFSDAKNQLEMDIVKHKREGF